MSELVADCPRCGAKQITFDLNAAIPVAVRHGWQRVYEAFCVCRHCKRGTIFVLAERDAEAQQWIEKSGGLTKVTYAANRYAYIDRYVSLIDEAQAAPPEHVPGPIVAIFKEGATCLAVQCFNAAGTMFRLCVDLATVDLLPQANENGLNQEIRRSLGRRLKWLFDNGKLPEAYRDLSHCIKEDGNDGAHAGTLTKLEAEDLLDFTTNLLERLYTEPERVELAKVRREQRRKSSD
jgi:Domain of unknown function (DUF4145)